MNDGRRNWGRFFARVVIAAVIIGVLGGGIFTGVSYVGMKALGVQRPQTEASGEAGNVTTTVTTQDLSDGVVEPVQTASLEIADASDIAEAVMPCIVAITNYSTITYQGFFGGRRTQDIESCGSGILVAQDENYLYVATNNHVVSGAKQLTVQFVDGSVVNAQVKGTYEAKDLAVVQVLLSDVPTDTLSGIRLIEVGDSTTLRVGEVAIAIGNALGYGQTVTTGIVSALGREVTVADPTTGVAITNTNLIQTDAAINPGNSGGALLNASGQLIGINSAKYSDTSVEGFGFAIPTEDAWPIITQLIDKEKVAESDAPYLGIQGQDVSASVAEANGMPTGVYVYNVVANSPAEQYGILIGDVITEFNGKTVYSMDGLREQMAYTPAGTEVTIVLYRLDENGEYQMMKLTVILANISSYSI